MGKVSTLLNLLFLTTIFILSTLPTQSDACSCMPEHPQVSYCNSEFVIYARILRRKVVSQKNQRIAYKIDIRKKYKMTDKAEFHLEKGILTTPVSESFCGIDLKIGKLYVIMGKTANISICNFIKPVANLSHAEKRAITVGYKHGCDCKFNEIPRNIARFYKANQCNFSIRQKCEMDYGVCVPKRARYVSADAMLKCHWRPTTEYRNCLANP